MPNLYATLDDMKAELAYSGSDAAKEASMLLWLEAASRVVDNYCHRRFLPYAGVLKLRLPQASRLLTFGTDVISVTSVSVDGVVSSAVFDLMPMEAPIEGIPYSGLLLRDSYIGPMALVEVDGLFGWPGDALAVSTLSSSIADGVASTATVPTGTVKVGSTLRVDSEYLYVSGRTTGTPNDTLTILRGQNGSPAAAHAGGAVVYRMRAPVAIEAATLAHASRLWKRRNSAWANVAMNTDMGTMELFKGIDADVAVMLDPYMRYS